MISRESSPVTGGGEQAAGLLNPLREILPEVGSGQDGGAHPCAKSREGVALTAASSMAADARGLPRHHRWRDWWEGR